MTITTKHIGVVNGLDVTEVYKDGVLIGTNASAPDDAEEA